MTQVFMVLEIPQNRRVAVFTPRLQTQDGIYKSNRNKGNVVASTKSHCCVWCTYEFTTEKCFIPIKLVDKTFVGFGSFCSYNCAYTYLVRDGTGVENKSYSLTLLHKMHHLEYGKYMDFAAMPHRIVLEKYNDGGLTIEEYRKNVHDYGSEIILAFPEPRIERVEHEMRTTDYGSFKIVRRV